MQASLTRLAAMPSSQTAGPAPYSPALTPTPASCFWMFSSVLL